MPYRNCTDFKERKMTSALRSTEVKDLVGPLIKTERATYAEAVVEAAKHFCLIRKLSDYKLRMLTR